jgi:MGT family glycosyltransferase
VAKVVVLNLPEHGHMNATYPVICELARRGEEVVYYATDPYRENVIAAGAEFTRYGDAKLFEPPAHTGGLHSVMAWEAGLAEQLLPRLVEEVKEMQPDYLLIDSMCVWGNLVQQILQIPSVCLASVFVPNDRTVTVEKMIDFAYGHAPKPVVLAGIDAMNTYIETSRRIDHRFGTLCPNIVEFFSNRQALNLLFTAREFHPEGDSFCADYKFVGPMLDFERQDSVADANLPIPGDDPLVYISMGTIFNDLPDFYRTCLQAYASAPFRVLISIGGKVNRAGLGPVPHNIQLCDYVPQLTVLKQASVFISHGGMNSVSEALAHGVPLLVLPQHGDQHLVAAQVERMGAGMRGATPDMTAPRLRELTEMLVRNPRFAAGARAVAQAFARCGGAPVAANAILNFVQSTTCQKVSSEA